MIYKKGEIELSPFTENDDMRNYRTWFDKPEIVKFTSHGIFPKTEQEFGSYLENNGNGYICYKIEIWKGQVSSHIGNVALQQINWVNRSAEVAIIIGEQDWQGKGIATFAVKCMLYHAFAKMNLHRVWTGTCKLNKGMQKVAYKCGFQEEGVFNEGKFLDGKYYDIIAYGILAPDFYQNIEEDFLKELE